jgi:hypothetical protein
MREMTRRGFFGALAAAPLAAKEAVKHFGQGGVTFDNGITWSHGDFLYQPRDDDDVVLLLDGLRTDGLIHPSRFVRLPRLELEAEASEQSIGKDEAADPFRQDMFPVSVAAQHG